MTARQTTIMELVGESHARKGDPVTSKQAANTLSSKHTMMRVLLNVFAAADDGLTSEQACLQAGYSAEDGAWKRVSDLKRQGLIVPDEGVTRPSSSGRAQQVLVITDDGRGAL